MRKYFLKGNRGLLLKTGGFSFIELIISIAIFVVLTSMLTFGYGSLNSRVNVDTLAHNIGQWVREAQISSMGVRRATDGTFPPGYGIRFTAGANNFIYFRDLDSDGAALVHPNKRYDGASELEQRVDLLQGYTISSICGEPGAATLCGVAGQTNLASVDITFSRPEPDANITGPSGTYSPARIIVSSPKGIRRAVVVYATGQVSIQTAP